MREQGSVQQHAVARSPWPVQAICKTDGFLSALHSHSFPSECCQLQPLCLFSLGSSAKSRVGRVAAALRSCRAVLSHGVQHSDPNGHTIPAVS